MSSSVRPSPTPAAAPQLAAGNQESRVLWDLLAAKATEARRESLVLPGRWDSEGTWDLQDRWVCQALRGPVACPSLERLVDLDQKETLEILVSRDRRAPVVLQVPLAPWDQLESKALKDRMDPPDREAPRGPWVLQDLQDFRVQQGSPAATETPDLQDPRGPRATREREATLLLRT